MKEKAEQLPSSEFDWPLAMPPVLEFPRDFDRMEAKLEHIKELYREQFGVDVHEELPAVLPPKILNQESRKTGNLKR